LVGYNFMWLLHIHDLENVYVNVTHMHIIWKTVLNILSWLDKCLCECYMHDLENVHVNVTYAW
jgi:hypothetical protein